MLKPASQLARASETAAVIDYVRPLTEKETAWLAECAREADRNLRARTFNMSANQTYSYGGYSERCVKELTDNGYRVSDVWRNHHGAPWVTISW